MTEAAKAHGVAGFALYQYGGPRVRLRFEGTFEVAAPREEVFQAVTDPDQVARCMPDLQKLEVKSADEFDAVVKVGVSFVRGEFLLNFKTVERQHPSRVRMKAHGTGLGSAVDVEMATDLTETPSGGTSMKWTAEAQVSGKVASLGQRLMQSQADKIIRQLFDCLRGKLE